MTEPLYRIEELSTTGWEVFENKTMMTKERASEEYKLLVEREGLNPNRLRVRRDA